MTIQEYFGDWASVIDLHQADTLLRKVIALKQPLCPSVSNIFKAFKLCSLFSLRVVILGQDPYPYYKNGSPVATGIAFANTIDTPIIAYSPSLVILRESVIDFTKPHGNINFDPSLEKWEEQGVLMLNSALSCKQGSVGSHTLIWRPFIKSFLSSLSLHSPGVVYVLMGSDAQSFESYINSKSNYILKVKHPSWYARNKLVMPSSLWQDINKILIGQNGYGIQWYKEC